MASAEEHVRKHFPRCILGVDATPIAPFREDDRPVTAFELAQLGTEAANARVFGYPLSDYNDRYDGSEFISPLSLKWPDESLVCVFDSDLHGYHGEMDSSAKLRGDGQAVEFLCRSCSGTSFQIRVQFDYIDDLNEFWEEEPDLAIQDYFENILFEGTCTACGSVNTILDMDL